MTPRLNFLLKKWRFYKRCLVVFLALNILSVSMAFFLGVNYLTTKRHVGKAQEKSLHTLEQSDLALKQLAIVEDALASLQKFNLRDRTSDVAALKLFEDWQKFKGAYHEVMQTPMNRDLAELLASGSQVDFIISIKNEISAIKTKALLDAKTQLSAYEDNLKLIIWAGVFTVVFGIILPLLVLYLLTKALNQVRIEIQKAAIELVRQFTATKMGFGDEAFKNVEFWLQILLLVGEQLSMMTSHPAAQISGEIAHVVRLEMLKKHTSKAA